jgi:hypothetical protein
MGDTPDRPTPTLGDGSWEHPSGGGTTATADPVPVRAGRITDMAGGVGKPTALTTTTSAMISRLLAALGDRSIVRALR